MSKEGNYLTIPCFCTSVQVWRCSFPSISQAKLYFRGNFLWIQKSEVTKMPNADCGRNAITDWAVFQLSYGFTSGLDLDWSLTTRVSGSCQLNSINISLFSFLP